MKSVKDKELAFFPLYAVKLWRSATQRIISLTFIGMLLGLAVDVLIAAKLGTGQTADALIIALSLPLLIDTATRAGTNYSMVPLFMERQTTSTEAEYQRFVSGLLNFVLVVGFIVAVLLGVLAPWIVSLLAPGLSPEGKIESTFLLRVCAPMVIFSLGLSILIPLLYSQKLFTPVALRNAVAPGVVVAAIGLVWNRENIAPWVAAAYVVGFAGFFLTLFLNTQRMRYRYQWSAWASKDDLVHLWRATSLTTLGFVVRQGSRVVERLLASLAVVGGVASYYFAFRIFSAVQTLIGGNVATVGLPGMAKHSSAGDKPRLANKIRKNLMQTLLLSLPVVIFILVFHVRIISWVYGRGSFGQTSIRQTSSVLFWLTAGLAFFCMVPVLQSGLYAQKAYRLVFRNMFNIACVNMALAWLLSRWWGLTGIAMAVSLSSMISTVNLVYLLNKTGVPLLQKNHEEVQASKNGVEV